ncbi:MAG: CPBP family intramembrane metalloprotease [Clostridia bacterium]|nr:CPBP family intramembrane metalloprotease [Clostridia bacterium]
MRTLTKGEKALLAALLVFLLRYPVACTLNELIPDTWGSVAVYVRVILRETVTYLLPGMAVFKRHKQVSCKTQWYHIPAALAAGVMAQYALSALTEVWTGYAGLSSAGVMPMPTTTAEWVPAVLALVLIPAIAEEVFFRGLLQGTLQEEHSPVTALLLSTASFALMHGSPAGLPAHLGCGLLLGVLYAGCGSLPLCMLFHGAYNGAAVVWSCFPVATSLPWVILCAGVLLLSAGYLLRSAAKKGGRLTRAEWALAGLLLVLEVLPYFF